MSQGDTLPRIRSLPVSVANQIAAGEVIERPASVVKELVENAIDAGADRIEIDIQAGGTGKVLVRDNGYGIHPDDMELAVRRHSTSKLDKSEDLEFITSLGFRGEALSSIASVSDFTLTSRIATGQHGWQIRIDPVNDHHELLPAAHQIGTSVEVRNLFRPTPARRKFLRAEKTEYLHILEQVKRLALAGFGFDLVFRHNGKTVLTCHKTTEPAEHRVRSVMGTGFCDGPVMVDSQNKGMRLWGWMGGKGTDRSQSDRQFLYLNGRTIRDTRINHAIRMALGDAVPSGRYPSYVLYLFIDPAAVDVNVHPTKQEVRFRRARDVHDFIYAGLIQAWQSTHAAHVVRNDVKAKWPVNQSSLRINEPILSVYRRAGDSHNSRSGAERQVLSCLTELGTPLVLIQSRYIIAVYQQNLRIIDLVEARRLYLLKRLREDISCGSLKSRPLLVPVEISLTGAEMETLDRYVALLNSSGLAIEASGPASLMVRSIPALVADADIQDMIREVLAILPTGNDREGILPVLAKHGSVSVGENTGPEALAGMLQNFTGQYFPVHEDNYRNVWRTLTGNEIRSLVDGK